MKRVQSRLPFGTQVYESQASRPIHARRADRASCLCETKRPSACISPRVVVVQDKQSVRESRSLLVLLVIGLEEAVFAPRKAAGSLCLSRRVFDCVSQQDMSCIVSMLKMLHLIVAPPACSTQYHNPSCTRRPSPTILMRDTKTGRSPECQYHVLEHVD